MFNWYKKYREENEITNSTKTNSRFARRLQNRNESYRNLFMELCKRRWDV